MGKPSAKEVVHAYRRNSLNYEMATGDLCDPSICLESS
jgi:hypothetical protein